MRLLVAFGMTKERFGMVDVDDTPVARCFLYLNCPKMIVGLIFVAAPLLRPYNRRNSQP